jgi:aldose 1-epimerase
MKPVLTATVYALGVGSRDQPDGRRPMIAPSGEQIEIAVGDQQAVVVEVGGGLRSYSSGSRELVDGSDQMSSSGRGQVLIPWPNRLQDDRYEFDSRQHQLPLPVPLRCLRWCYGA